MPKLPRFGVFLAQSVPIMFFGSAALAALIHAFLAVPLRDLVMPWLLYSAFGTFSCLLLYWSVKREVSSGGDRRPLTVTVGAICLLGALLISYCSMRLGIISINGFRGLSITTLITVPPITVLAYYLLKHVSPPPYTPLDPGKPMGGEGLGAKR